MRAGDFKLTLVGSFADQARNLELMLRVAYADDDLEDAEASLIAGFCHIIGVTQDQIDRIESEVLASLKPTDVVCLSCGASAEPNAKFCPGCGAAFGTEEPIIQTDFQIPRTGIAIAFADSTAASFAKALTLAKNSSGYQTCQKNKKTWHLAPFSQDLSRKLCLWPKRRGASETKSRIRAARRRLGMKCSDSHGVLPSGRLLIARQNIVLGRTRIVLIHGVVSRHGWTGLIGLTDSLTVHGRKLECWAER